ncbi:Cell surface protein [Oopsacas minuta]|uniref:Cell surface protein n=1 Tax=Oopsacas minuta TaxID=111878 RepID=A0AAV7JHS3_9METZ|nr:Cell surface protein [Oopsacas minuta]
MATASLDIEREDNFEIEIQRVRENIQIQFIQIIDCLKVRENVLLKELDNVLASYYKYRNEIREFEYNSHNHENIQVQTSNQLPVLSPAISLQDNSSERINEVQDSIKTPQQPHMVKFVCDNSKLLSEADNLGKLVESVGDVINYTIKSKPIISVCKGGYEIDQLYRPHGVTFDRNSGNIYVADCYNNCVKVFDCVGRYIFKIGDDYGDGKMKWPRSLAICGDRILITQGDVISQSTHKIFSFSLDGIFVCKIGKRGTGELKFILPTGLTFDEFTEYVYVCDSGNNRVQVLAKDLTYISQFGREILFEPCDVKLSIEYIFVLDNLDPCLHLFDYDHVPKKSVISRKTGLQNINPFYFFIDKYDNILFSENDYNSILIFNSEFNFVHRITVSTSPMGIAVDQQGRVIIVCQAKNNCLQIF